MNQDLDNKLCKDFPNLFVDRKASMQVTCMCWGFACGDGWYGIIREAAEQLEPLIVEIKQKYPNDFPRASQVKEKFGTLRFYLSHGTDQMYDIVSEAERKSDTTCEYCGKKGKLRKGGWLKTLCNTCHKKEEGDQDGISESLA